MVRNLTVALVLSLALAGSAQAASPDITISQVYGGGGNSGATYTNDFIQLYNRSSAPVSVEGWSVQYAAASGTSWQVTPLAGTIAPGEHYLVQEAAGAGGTEPLPTPDATGSIAMSATSGKVALRTEATACTGECVTTARDFVGYGAANQSETAPAPGLSNTTAALRASSGDTDTDNNAADFTAGEPQPGETDPGPPPVTGLRIHDIQGAHHRSPYEGQVAAEVPGVVTASSSNGFWMQDTAPDADDATSEGIFVFRGTATVGQKVLVTGRVEEFRPGGDADNLTTTELSSPTVTVDGTGTVAPTLVGPSGRRPPQRVIEDDALGDVEMGDVLFDPAEDGIDFHESLEGMLVQVQNPEVVGPTNGFGEIPVVARGAASVRSARGGVVIREEDFNPERMILDDVIANPEPAVNVGDGFSGPLTAVVDYSFGNFKYLVTPSWPTRVDNRLQREVTQKPTGRQVAIASMNVENLDPLDPPEKFDELAEILVHNLRAPDIVALEEVQDDNGPAAGDTDATATWNAFIEAIRRAKGPRYEFRQINPENNTDGGEPDGNIRVGFLFRPDRQVRFVDRPGGTATTRTAEDTTRRGAQLTFSPGRIDPGNPAFAASRKPLAGEFRVRGKQLFVIANHFNSKGGDQPLFGRTQPPVRSSEEQRHAQARVVRDFVRSLLRADFTAPVVVLGDFNDFEFSETLRILESAGLGNLMRLLPQSQRYSYVFDGNSQVLDQILVSLGTLGWIPEYDSVHVNAEFADQASDHDPQVARLTLP